MADGDRQLAFTTGPVPTAVQVSGPDRLTPKAVNASFDGTGAAGDFLPCLIITGRTGHEVARIPAPKVAAGASAEVSWFPRVGGAIATPVGPGSQLDFVSKVFPVNLVITTTVEANAVKIIESNPVACDGATQVRIEFHSPDVRMATAGGGGIPDLGGFLNLWMDNTNLGIIRYTDQGSSDSTTDEYAFSGTEQAYLTPPAGTHRFSIRGWCQQPGCEMRIINTVDRVPTTLVTTATGA